MAARNGYMESASSDFAVERERSESSEACESDRLRVNACPARTLLTAAWVRSSEEEVADLDVLAAGGVAGGVRR